MHPLITAYLERQKLIATPGNIFVMWAKEDDLLHWIAEIATAEQPQRCAMRDYAPSWWFAHGVPYA